jgi:hypothetical protein
MSPALAAASVWLFSYALLLPGAVVAATWQKRERG